MTTILDLSFALFVAIFSSLLIVRYLVQRGRAKATATVSDEEFIKRFGSSAASSEKILAERRRVARILGVPESNLSPEQTYEQLKQRFEFLGQVSVGWSDLQYELIEKSPGFRDQSSASPLTIGTIIQLRLEMEVT